eukprot:scaffold88203_cov54-Phaeocystis_antarctica.AAC.2
MAKTFDNITPQRLRRQEEAGEIKANTIDGELTRRQSPLAKKITEYIIGHQDDAAQEDRWRTTMKRDMVKHFRVSAARGDAEKREGRDGGEVHAAEGSPSPHRTHAPKVAIPSTPRPAPKAATPTPHHAYTRRPAHTAARQRACSLSCCRCAASRPSPACCHPDPWSRVCTGSVRAVRADRLSAVIASTMERPMV